MDGGSSSLLYNYVTLRHAVTSLSTHILSSIAAISSRCNMLRTILSPQQMAVYIKILPVASI